MPYKIVKVPGGYAVAKARTGKKLPGKSSSKAMAQRRIRAIGASEHQQTTGGRRNYHRRGN